MSELRWRIEISDINLDLCVWICAVSNSSFASSSNKSKSHRRLLLSEWGVAGSGVDKKGLRATAIQFKMMSPFDLPPNLSRPVLLMLFAFASLTHLDFWMYCFEMFFLMTHPLDPWIIQGLTFFIYPPHTSFCLIEPPWLREFLT